MKSFNFDNSYTKLPHQLFTKLPPEKVDKPEVVIYNHNLAEELDIKLDNIEEFLSGNNLMEGSEPIAQAYAGHQFGHLSILGDGRAILLGEHLKDGERFDIQLKGSGRTPYSRNGDGRATLYSMLREYLISHAMTHLGIETTKSLAVVKTGEDVYREEIHDGAILTRVASSHIRVGTFQNAALTGDLNTLKELADYTIERHYPHLIESDEKYSQLLSEVMDRQITLIINWLRVGFIHGVMNTDNMTISGETIDYGPCAFMDTYNPDTVFSSIDTYGRYSYINQRSIGGWNLARFAETLVPLINSDSEKALKMVNKILEEYNPKFEKKWFEMMGNKLGFTRVEPDDFGIISELLNWMNSNGADFTVTFRTLSNGKKGKVPTEWFENWQSLDPDYQIMKRNNPAVIPRNNIVEDVLKRGAAGDMAPFKEFMDILKRPYEENSDYYESPPLIINAGYRTFCGT